MDRERHAAARRRIQFGEEDAGHTHGFVKLARLSQRVLPGSRVQHQPDRVRRAGQGLAHHTLHFAEFLHQVEAGLQTPGSINQNDVHAAGHTRLDGVERHRAGIGLGRARHHRDLEAVAPNLELVHRRGAKGVRRAEEDGLPLR